jgi:hypothetical protein
MLTNHFSIMAFQTLRWENNLITGGPPVKRQQDVGKLKDIAEAAIS